jgi:hypothetical protein
MQGRGLLHFHCIQWLWPVVIVASSCHGCLPPVIIAIPPVIVAGWLPVVATILPIAAAACLPVVVTSVGEVWSQTDSNLV